jgi:hypothetical protein
VDLNNNHELIVMYRGEFSFEKILGDGPTFTLEMVVPDEIESFLRKNVRTYPGQEGDILGLLGNHLALDMYEEGSYAWLNRKTLLPEKVASFYANDIGYIDNGEEYGPVSCKEPQDYDLIGWCLNNHDLSLDGLCSMSGEGVIGFACNRIFKKAYEGRNWNLDEVEELLKKEDMDPEYREQLLIIYPELSSLTPKSP